MTEQCKKSNVYPILRVDDRIDGLGAARFIYTQSRSGVTVDTSGG